MEADVFILGHDWAGLQPGLDVDVLGLVERRRAQPLAQIGFVVLVGLAAKNAILIVAGDTTLAEVLPLAQKYYGPIPSRPTPPRVRAQEPPQLAERRLIYRDARVRQPSITRSYTAPSRNEDPASAAALSVLASLLNDPGVRAGLVSRGIDIPADQLLKVGG